MKYISHANSRRPHLVSGEKQELRRARRSGSISARQQKKAIKLHRRLLKAA